MLRTARSNIDVRHASFPGASLIGIGHRSCRSDTVAAFSSISYDHGYRFSLWLSSRLFHGLRRQSFWCRFFAGDLLPRIGDCWRRPCRRSCRKHRRFRLAHGKNQSLAVAGIEQAGGAFGPYCGSWRLARCWPLLCLRLCFDPFGGGAAPKRKVAVIAPALAISASHGLLLCSAGADRGRFHPRRRMEPRRIVRRAGGDFTGRLRRGMGPLAVALADIATRPSMEEPRPVAGKAERMVCDRPARGDGDPAADVDSAIPRRHSKRAARRGSGAEMDLGLGRPLILFLVGRCHHDARPSGGMSYGTSYQFHLDRTASLAMSRVSCSSSARRAACRGFARRPAWRNCSVSACSSGTLGRAWRLADAVSDGGGR